MVNTLSTAIQAFFTERLVRDRGASPHTIASYRDTLRLLLVFATRRCGKQPTKLTIEDLDATLISAFLDHLERTRGCGARTRNLRLTAIRSLFRYCALRYPEHAALIERVLAIPPKRHDRALVTFLTEPELNALLNAPDRSTWTGRRDHALLLLDAQTGLRASELIALTPADVHLGTGAHVTTLGKGRKRRITPLTKETVAVVAAWIAENTGAGTAIRPVFATRTGRPLTRDALARRLAKYSAVAAERCPSLLDKNVTPHVFRHTAAMRLLHAGVDVSVIALWLGHEQVETTQVYLHADLAIKEQALAKTKPLDSPPGRYRPPDALLAFLEGLG
jgi:integrase/recombinase XerD